VSTFCKLETIFPQSFYLIFPLFHGFSRFPAFPDFPDSLSVPMEYTSDIFFAQRSSCYHLWREREWSNGRQKMWKSAKSEKSGKFEEKFLGLVKRNKIHHEFSIAMFSQMIHLWTEMSLRLQSNSLGGSLIRLSQLFHFSNFSQFSWILTISKFSQQSSPRWN